VRLPNRKFLLVGAGVGLVLLVGVVAAIAEMWPVAVICMLLLQASALVAMLEAIRRTGRHVAALERLSRDVTNVSARVVTESRAIQADLQAGGLRAGGLAGSVEGENPPTGQ
jgi:hypothetical protein